MTFMVNSFVMFPASGEFTPLDLFPSSEYGGWYDPSDTSTMWTDAGKTTNVASDGDLVYWIDDKSGNGLHLSQATSANRPIYKTSGGLHWLDFDGANDVMNSAALSPSIMHTAGSMAVSFSPDNLDAIGGVFTEEQTTTIFNRVSICCDTRTAKRLLAFSPSGLSGWVDLDSENNSDACIIATADNTTAYGYLNGTLQSSSASATENFADSTRIRVGVQGGLYFDGKFFGGLIIDRVITATERNNLNSYLSTKAGI